MRNVLRTILSLGLSFETFLIVWLSVWYCHSYDFSYYFSSKRFCHAFDFVARKILSRKRIFHWKTLLDQNKFILSLFIDFKKAFDLIDPKLLFLKLFHYGFDFTALRFVKIYSTNLLQKTKIKNSFLDLKPIFYRVTRIHTRTTSLYHLY